LGVRFLLNGVPVTVPAIACRTLPRTDCPAITGGLNPCSVLPFGAASAFSGRLFLLLLRSFLTARCRMHVHDECQSFTNVHVCENKEK